MQKLQISEFCYFLPYIKDTIFITSIIYLSCGKNGFLQIVGSIVHYSPNNGHCLSPHTPACPACDVRVPEPGPGFSKGLIKGGFIPSLP